jgi:two-component system, chemotaxis family, sensor kinase CheA
MDSPHLNTLHALLSHSGLTGIEIDVARQVCAIHNAQLLGEWLHDIVPDDGQSLPGLDELFGRLIDLHDLPRLQHELLVLRDGPGLPAANFGVFAGCRYDKEHTARHYEIRLEPLLHAAAGIAMLILRDVSEKVALEQALADARAAHATALTVVRASSDTLRLFLGSAMASVGAIRATLRLPARTQEALHDKLDRLHSTTVSLLGEAQLLNVTPVVDTGQIFLAALELQQQRDNVSGDDLLPLAPLIDRMASAIGNTWRVEEQRPQPALQTVEATGRHRQPESRQPRWQKASERRWNEFLRHRGEEAGKLVRLSMSGADIVPAGLRRSVDEMLQHLLRNAMDHGIETPEERLAAEKPAAGTIDVQFTDLGAAGFTLVARDDGRGFDVDRIGRAAVQCGLLSEESRQERGAGDIMRLIFKPSFSTEALTNGDGQGRGLAYLRRAVTQLNGQITVATKSGRYTEFTIQLPKSHKDADPEHSAQFAAP